MVKRQYPWVLEIDGIERARFARVSGGRKIVEMLTNMITFEAVSLLWGFTEDADLNEVFQEGSEVTEMTQAVPVELIRDYTLVHYDLGDEEDLRVILRSTTCIDYLAKWDEKRCEGLIGRVLLQPELIERGEE